MAFPAAVSAGALDEAQPLTVGLTKILNFLLLILGTVAILGIIIAGILYFTAGGDPRQVMTAKKAFAACIMGLLFSLGSMILVWTIARLLS